MKYAIQSYRREILTLSSIAAILSALVEIAAYRGAILSAVFSQTGITLLCFLAAGIDLCLVIKIHFRMIIIRYYEKDTRIRLFEG